MNVVRLKIVLASFLFANQLLKAAGAGWEMPFSGLHSFCTGDGDRAEPKMELPWESLMQGNIPQCGSDRRP